MTLRFRARSAPSGRDAGGGGAGVGSGGHDRGVVGGSPLAPSLPPLEQLRVAGDVTAHRLRDDNDRGRAMIFKEDALTRGGRTMHMLEKGVGRGRGHIQEPMRAQMRGRRSKAKPRMPRTVGGNEASEFTPPDAAAIPDAKTDPSGWLRYWASPEGVAHATHVFAGRVEWGLRNFILPGWGDDEGAIILGEGGDGVAWFAVEMTHMVPCVLKELYDGGGDREILIHSALQHPSITQFYTDFYDESRDSQFIVLEFCAGGSLFDHLPDEGGVAEATAREVVETVAEALRYLHGVGIVYADLKTTNILVTAEGALKVADFGAAHWVADRKRKLLRMTGTVDTQPPEMVQLSSSPAGSGALPRPLPRPASTGDVADLDRMKQQTPSPQSPSMSVRQGTGAGGFDERVDNWSLGVLLYRLLVGDYPFSFDVEDDDDDVIRGNILSLSYSIPDSVPAQAARLIRGLLQSVPRDRLSLAQVLRHPWLRGGSVCSDRAAASTIDFAAAAAQELTAWHESLRLEDLHPPRPLRELSTWDRLVASIDGPITKQTFFTSMVLVYLFGCFTVLHLQAYYGRRLGC